MTDAPIPPTGTDRARVWRWVFVIVGVVTLARIVYLVWLSPYELTGDEAHYWEWSRRPALSYYTKGPGVAWVIAASTRMFGTSEASVRLPAVLASAVAMLGVVGLGAVLAPTLRRAPLYALLAYLCVPAYHATALLMTIDGPMIACWIVAALGAMLALRGLMNGQRALSAHLLLGVALGVGFLFKYTILLMALGVVAAWIGARRALRGPRLPGACVAIGSALVCAAPVFIWNQRNGWPTVAHLLGHLGAPGGDIRVAPGEGEHWSPLWTLELIGSQLALIGPVIVLMFAAACAGASAEAHEREQRRLLAWCGTPTLVFYFLVSLFARPEGNWPVAGYATFAPLVGVMLARGVPGWRRALWHWSAGFGIVTALGMLMLPALARLPGLDHIVPVRRFSGARQVARTVEQEIGRAGLTDPVIIAARYQRAGLLAFYMQGRPRVYCAQHATGDRRTSYDDFADTDLREPSLIGRDAVLIDAGQRKWARSFDFDWIEQVREEPAPIYIARGYRGPSAPVPRVTP